MQRTADHLGLRHTRLNDRVRDQRGPADPWTLSEGSASEWVDLLTRLAADAVVSAAVSRRVLSWLRAGADLSMVAQPLGLDPLAHAAGDRGMRLWHKTGTDDGTRADVGLLRGPAGHGGLRGHRPVGPGRTGPADAGARSDAHAGARPARVRGRSTRGWAPGPGADHAGPSRSTGWAVNGSPMVTSRLARVPAGGGAVGAAT